MENCGDNKVNQLSKVLEKEEEGGITGLATTIHQVNPKNRRMEGRNDKQMKSRMATRRSDNGGVGSPIVCGQLVTK